MHEKLINLGWVKYHECNTCSGHRKYYNHPLKPGYEVRSRVKTNTFSILQKNIVIAGPFWGYQLEEKLKANGL